MLASLKYTLRHETIRIYIKFHLKFLMVMIIENFQNLTFKIPKQYWPKVLGPVSNHLIYELIIVLYSFLELHRKIKRAQDKNCNHCMISKKTQQVFFKIWFTSLKFDILDKWFWIGLIPMGICATSCGCNNPRIFFFFISNTYLFIALT